MVTFDHVTKVYKGDYTALNDVSFFIDKGEFCFIVGASGAGKSTIIRLLVRQEFPTQGEIMFEDINVPQIPRKLLSFYRQQLGIVFQDLKLIPSKTVLENVEFALEIINKPKKEINETANYLLEIVKLQDKGKLFPDQLSGGERQRIAIARALANDPKLFIADEPTGNLDPETAYQILEILKKINSWGTTVIVVTHDKDIVDNMQTRVLHMAGGNLVEDRAGGYDDVRSAAASKKETPQKGKTASDLAKKTKK
ncbi:MAG: cell division ATP-binding protein FtsE [Candidatus Dojkabacteria bacterium]